METAYAIRYCQTQETAQGQDQFNPERPNAVWCSDITYIWTMEGFVYLTSIMDLYSRKIIAWTLSKILETSCVIETINKAKAKRSTDRRFRRSRGRNPERRVGENDLRSRRI